MLWLAIHLPRFAVEIHAARPPAVTVTRGRVVAADGAAEAAGILPGMRLSSALGLAPRLTVCEPDPRHQAAALEVLACWAGSFTPQVSLAPPDELLLEIGGCLRLFGGLEALFARIAAGCEEQAYTFRLGLAPTPLAAQWLARGFVGAARVFGPQSLRDSPPGGQASVLGRPGGTCSGRERGFAGATNGSRPGGRSYEQSLAALPVRVLQLGTAAEQRLAVLGLKQIGQLLDLPQAGLARRFGPELPLQLARALGAVPDPRPAFVFPERFAQRLELPAKVERADMLLFAARRLVLALAGWLHARAAGLRECVLVLLHEDAPPTRLTLGFAGPTRDPERLARVLRERLERLVLTAPVHELRLEADDPEDLPGTTAGLFGAAGSAAIAPVVERLRARLGQEAVHGLAVVAEHRPERATRAVDWPLSAAPAPAPPRPLGLLPTPRALAEKDGAPWREGRLRLLTRAERIESGWWDGGEGQGDLARDYFVALSEEGEWLWIFRDQNGWWLHGIFA
jgi:protein ImuB